MDLVVRVPRHPHVGETVLGTSFATYPGGKGFNQALAASRLAADVTLIGCVGGDEFGRAFRGEIERAGIETARLRSTETGTGIAVPIVDDLGRNSIVMVPRANGEVSPADAVAAREVIERADVLMLQLEVPTTASAEAARIARRAGKPVIWNLAPYADISADELALATVIVVNEAEAGGLIGQAPVNDRDALEAARAIRSLGVANAVVTLGANGAVYEGPDGGGHVPAYAVRAVDTVGAGDAFCAGMAWSLARGNALAESVEVGNAAGALATLVPGAGPSMPSRARVEEMLGRALG